MNNIRLDSLNKSVIMYALGVAIEHEEDPITKHELELTEEELSKA